MPAVSMTVNGKAVTGDVDPRTLLVQFLRENLRLTGTHVGCDTSQCGACVVHVDGKAVKSCTMLAWQLEGANVTTIEGLAEPNGPLHPMQEAFRENHGLQCGFCTPGMIMTAVDIVRRKGNDLDEQDHPRTSSKAISAAAPATTTSSRRSRPAPRRWRAASAQSRRISSERTASIAPGGDRHERDRDRRGGAPQGRLRFITGKGQYTDDISRPGAGPRLFPALAACARQDQEHRHARPRRDAGRARGADRRRARRRQDRQPDLRLDDPLQGRLADEDGAASGAGARQGLLCRRSRSRW